MSVYTDFIMKGGVAMPTTNRRVLTIKEAAKLIDGLTEYRIRQIVRDSYCVPTTGQLPCFMTGKKYLIAEENLYKAVFWENYGKEIAYADSRNRAEHRSADRELIAV